MTRSGVVGWPKGLPGTLVWAMLVAVAIVVVVHARYTTDLSAFVAEKPISPSCSGR